MKPIVKYQGGKTRELPLIKTLLPQNYDTVLEPFAGGAAVSFALGHRCILNDMNDALINMYQQVSHPTTFHEVFSHVNWLKTLEHDDLSVEYYKARDYINGKHVDPYTWAISYITVRQLCFSGMERYNAKGKFNVPFGHYKKFSCNLDWNHMKFLHQSGSSIYHGDFAPIFDMATEDDFIFIDPPYLDRLGYAHGNDTLHERLVSCMHNTKAKWLFIHSDNDFYRDALSEYHIFYKQFGYAQRFGKNKNHDNAQVSHMYVTNYEDSMTLHRVNNASLQTLLEPDRIEA
mgnify:FL=1